MTELKLVESKPTEVEEEKVETFEEKQARLERERTENNEKVIKQLRLKRAKK